MEKLKRLLSRENHWFWKTDEGFQFVAFLDILLWSSLLILILTAN